MNAHHNRTIDTAVTPDRVSQHQINALTARGVRKSQLAGLRVILEEEIMRVFPDGRVFTVHDALALCLPRYQIEPPITVKDVGNALYRIAATTGKVYRTGGSRSGAYRVHAEGGPIPLEAAQRGSNEIVDQIVELLSELAQRVNRSEQIEAKLREIGVRIAP